MELRPIGNRVIIEQEAAKETSEGGIVIPKATQKAEKPIKGTVLAIGPGKYLNNGDLIEPKIVVGDKVLFGERAGEELDFDGDKLLVMDADAVLAVILDENND